MVVSKNIKWCGVSACVYICVCECRWIKPQCVINELMQCRWTNYVLIQIIICHYQSEALQPLLANRVTIFLLSLTICLLRYSSSLRPHLSCQRSCDEKVSFNYDTHTPNGAIPISNGCKKWYFVLTFFVVASFCFLLWFYVDAVPGNCEEKCCNNSRRLNFYVHL